MTEPLKRIGAIGDIHAEDRSLAAVLTFLHTRDLDLIVSTGDIIDGTGSAARCCQLLQDAQVTVVCGNHDRWFLEGVMRRLPWATPLGSLDGTAHAFLQALPRTCSFETVAGRLLLCHGLGENDMCRLIPDDSGYALEVNDDLQALLRARDYAFVVNGHTHRRMVRTFHYLTVINAGTLYAPHDPCFLIADFEARRVEYFDLKVNDEIVQAETFDLPTV